MAFNIPAFCYLYPSLKNRHTTLHVLHSVSWIKINRQPTSPDFAESSQSAVDHLCVMASSLAYPLSASATPTVRRVSHSSAFSPRKSIAYSNSTYPIRSVHIKSESSTTFGNVAVFQVRGYSLAKQPRVKVAQCAAADASNSFSSVPEPLVESVESSIAPEAPPAESLTKTLQLGALFGMWYLFNIYLNIYNKHVRPLLCVQPRSFRFQQMKSAL